MLSAMIDRANHRLPPFSAEKNASDKRFKDCLLWLSLLAYFKEHGEDHVVFVMDDKILSVWNNNGIHRNCYHLGSPFHERRPLLPSNNITERELQWMPNTK